METSVPLSIQSTNNAVGTGQCEAAAAAAAVNKVEIAFGAAAVTVCHLHCRSNQRKKICWPRRCNAMLFRLREFKEMLFARCKLNRRTTWQQFFSVRFVGANLAIHKRRMVNNERKRRTMNTVWA